MSKTRILAFAAGVGLALVVVTWLPSKLVIDGRPASHGYGNGPDGFGYGHPCPTSLSLGLSKQSVVAGQPVTASGALIAEPGFGVGNRPIKYFQATWGTGTPFTQIWGSITNGSGNHGRVLYPQQNVTFKTQWGGTTDPVVCPAVESGRASVRVYVRVPWVFDIRPRVGVVPIRGSVRPHHPVCPDPNDANKRCKVIMEYYRFGDTAKRYETLRLDANSNFFGALRFDRSGTWFARALFFDPDPFHEGNYGYHLTNRGPSFGFVVP